jgi:hypothetical protein
MDPWLPTAPAFLAAESARPVNDIEQSAEFNLERSTEDQMTLSLEKSRDSLGAELQRRSFSSTSGRYAFSFGHFPMA